MRNIHMLKWWIGLAALMLISCDSWLDVKPDDKVLQEDLFSTQEGFNTALNGIYLNMAEEQLYGKELSCGLIEAMGQLYNIPLQMTGNTSPYYYFTQYKYTDPKIKGYLERTWEAMYKVIGGCNNLLEQAVLHKSVFAKEQEYNLYLGKLYALRAFLHFDVFRLWGPVYNDANKKLICIPYYTKRVSLPVPLSTAEEVVGYLLNDLNKADSLMPSEVSAQKMDIDQFGVRALRARVYLYIGQKEKAYHEAARMIGEGGNALSHYSFVEASFAKTGTNPDRLFYTEQIFMLENSQRDKLYEENFDHTLQNETFMSTTLENINTLFRNTDDYRYYQWKVNPGGGKAVSFVKFEQISDDGPRARGQSLLKLSELYLIMAECASTEEERVKYLDKLRVGRGYQEGSVGADEKGGWVNTIENEYKREFCGEGQFFFYLKRMNKSLIGSGTGTGDITMGSAQYQLPLPENESQYR